MRLRLGDFEKKYKPKQAEEIPIEVKQKEYKEVCEKIKGYGFQELNKKIFSETAGYISATKLKCATQGLLLSGGTGTGKTVACELLSVFLDEYEDINGYQSRLEGNFYCCYGLSFSYLEAKNKIDFLNGFRTHRTLVFDDLGDESIASDYGNKNEVMARILTERYKLFVDHDVKTVISTNLTGEDLKARYGGRLYSRLTQMCKIVDARGRDLRAESL